MENNDRDMTVDKISKKPFLKESQIMKIHYITGLVALFAVAIHIMMRLITPSYNMSLEYANVINNYHNIFYAILLESILVLIAIHGFNGLRIILLELRQDERWEKFITIIVIIAMISIIAYGTRTIIIANGLTI